MTDATVTLAPSIPDLRALGAERPEDVLGIGGALAEEARAERVSSDARSELVRCPLPGTALDGGRLAGRPRGAGTGWVLVRRYRDARLGERLTARLTRPRSDSLAAREWNLYCRLRAGGVATPEPLALVRETDRFFARRSALVTRELEGFLPAREWLARDPEPADRRLALRAAGLALARLRRSGVELPRLSLGHLWIAAREGAACAAREAPPVDGRLRRRRLPDVAVTSVRGGRERRPSDAAWRALLLRLGGEARALLSPRERLRAWLLATRDSAREERRPPSDAGGGPERRA